jgi:hypothetical protein
MKNLPVPLISCGFFVFILMGCTKNLEEQTKNLEGQTKNLEEQTRNLEEESKDLYEKLKTVEIEHKKATNAVEERIKLIEEKNLKQEINLTALQEQNRKLESRLEKVNDLLIARNQQDTQEKISRKKEELRSQFSSLKKVNDATNLGVNSKNYASLILNSKENVELLADNNLLDQNTRNLIKKCWRCYEDADHFWKAFVSMVSSNTTVSGGGMVRNVVEEFVIPKSGIDSRQDVSALVKEIDGDIIYVGPVLSVLWFRCSSNFTKIEAEIEKIMKPDD